MRHIIIYSIFLFLLFIETRPLPYRAFCHVPVADLFTYIPRYKHIEEPWDTKKSSSLYPRASQLLYNEQVIVTEEQNNYSHINIFHWFYIPAKKKDPVTDYWVLSSTLTRINNYDKKLQSCIPEPISFKDSQLYYKNVVTLKYPYTHKDTTYSAGTRFVKAADQHKKSSTLVKIYNQSTQKCTTEDIPSSYLLDKKIDTNESKRSLFLSLLESWTETETECFPYVLGGASVTSRHSHNEKISSKIINIDGTKNVFYYRPLQKATIPMGIDCSHLITRAAHIAQIPIFARNTTTFIRTYSRISQDYRLQNGDLIIWSGHCCIVADTENNLAIESRGYTSGYGKIQKIILSSLFKNVDTYKELLKKYYMHQPLHRIDKEGKVTQKIDDFSIIPLIP